MSAVEDFAVATGIQVLYDRPSGGNPSSPGVHGLMTPQAALKALLEGTGLAARFTDPDNAVLEPIGDDAPALTRGAGGPPPADLPKLSLDPLKVQGALVLESAHDDGQNQRLYAAMIRNGVQQALAHAPKTSKDDYDATLDLWIGPKGEVQRASIAASSGNGERDIAILSVVQGLTLDEPPPSGLPQPIRIGVRSRRRRPPG
jgi:hypothetical protein